MRRQTMGYCRLIERRCFKLLSCCFESRIRVHEHVLKYCIQALFRNAYVQIHNRLTYALICNESIKLHDDRSF